VKPFVLLFALLLPACALLPQTARDQGANLTNKVCATLAIGERHLLRDQINASLQDSWNRADPATRGPKPAQWCGVVCPTDPADSGGCKS